MPGATTQAAKTCDAPSMPQLTLPMPTEAVAVPTRPPMRECVVETGRPWRVAMVRNMEEPMMVQVMARRRTAGVWLNTCGSRIRRRMVSVTLEPTIVAPLNSMTAAMAMACFMVTGTRRVRRRIA